LLNFAIPGGKTPRIAELNKNLVRKVIERAAISKTGQQNNSLEDNSYKIVALVRTSISVGRVVIRSDRNSLLKNDTENQPVLNC